MPATELASDLLKDLTASQRAAVTHRDGPLLIVAAAGSGKTRVITRRVAYLLTLGIPPTGILAITFTNKAANEMKQRISAISPTPLRDWGRLDQPWPIICTFHSLCLRILKHYAPQIGLPPNFSIFDSADQNRLIKEALKSLELSTTNFPPARVHSAISNAKNQLIDAPSYARDAQDFFSRTLAKVYTKYQALLTANNALDFDDLLMRVPTVLRDHPQILRELQERFAYILIDEYQDTNHAQYILAHALASRHRNLCVVGDPDQSIYAWRGADVENILSFEKDYPDAVVIRLEQNYRSTKTILAIADQLISHNTRRKEKKLWTENPQGEKARVFLCRDEHDEAHAVTAELQEMSRLGVPWKNMAIFYRMNSLSRVMEDGLRRAGVPYQIARGVEFYGRKEIKDVLAYLRLLVNPADEISLTRILNVPTRGIGDNTVKFLQVHSVAHHTNLWQTLLNVSNREIKGTGPFISDAAQTREQIKGAVPFISQDNLPIPDGLSTRAIAGIARFVDLIESLRMKMQAANANPDLPNRVQSIMDLTVRNTGLEALLKKEDPDGENELANVNELISAASEFDQENPQGTLEDYLSAVSLVSDADHLEGAGGSVTLMTLHAAKGLEFPVVAMIGLEEGCLPHARAQDDPEDLEEERRLCFVGITRSQERLILSKAAYRTIRGLRERTATSQFLSQMPQEFLEITDLTGDSQSPARSETYIESDESMPVLEFSIGQRVRHPAFGIGKILDLSNSSIAPKAVVHFEKFGRKTLVLNMAKLTPV
jgi:DNA helicase-2/ATP-dependent DNA helicase PcrA